MDFRSSLSLPHFTGSSSSPPRGFQQLHAPFSEQLIEQFLVCGRQLAYGTNSAGAQRFRSRLPHKQQLCDGQRKDLLTVIFAGEDRNRVGLFHIRRQFCENLVEADADGNGQTQLFPDGAADFFRDLLPAPEQGDAGGHIQRAFVDAARFDAVGETFVYRAHLAGESLVFPEMRFRPQHVRTLSQRRSHRFRRFDAEFFCLFVFGEHDAPPLLRIAADDQRFPFKFGMEQGFHRRKKIIQIGIQNHPFLHSSPQKTNVRLFLSIIHQPPKFVNILRRTKKRKNVTLAGKVSFSADTPLTSFLSRSYNNPNHTKTRRFARFFVKEL